MSGWRVRTLGEVAQVSAGNSAPQDERFFLGGTHPFFRTSDIGQIHFGDIYEAADHLNDEGAKGLRRFPKDTILFPKSGASTFLNHRVMLGIDGFVASHLATIVADTDRVDPRFLLYYLSTISAQDMVQDHAYPSLNLPSITGIRIAVPPLADQLLIVGILDDVRACIGTAKANTEKNLRNARAIFESHLQSVFTENVGSLVERRLSDLCLRITVGHVGSMATKYKNSGVPFLRSQNIRPFEVVLDNVVFIDSAFHQSLAKSRLRPGDLAIVRTGYPGTAAVIPSELPDSNCADLVIMSPGPEVDPHYLAAFFNSDFGKTLVGGKLVGAAQKHFNVTAAKGVMLRLPPMRVQQEMVERVDALRCATRRLESVCQRKLDDLDELWESLLHQAFSGQLGTLAA